MFPYPPTPLITVTELWKRTLRDSTVDTNADPDDRAYGYIVTASQFLQNMCNRRFDYYLDTIQHDCYSAEKGGDVQGRVLFLRADLRSLTSINTGGETVPTAAVVQEPRTAAYKRMLKIVDTTYYWHWNDQNTPEAAIDVVGAWGYGGGYVLQSQTASAIATTNTTSVTVSAAGLERGMVIRIDSEDMLITAPSKFTGGTALTVQRGYNGTTAATHSAAAAIYRFMPDPLAAELTGRLAQWVQEQDKSPLFGTATFGETSIPLVLDAIPRDVKERAALSGLQRKPQIKVFGG